MRRPVVQIIGQSGGDLVPNWGSSLISVRFTDNEGGDADELEIDISVALPLPAPPPVGTKYRLLYGWETGALRDAGLFTSQSPRLNYSAEDGWVMTVVARSADFVDADKAADSEHYDEQAAGEIFRKLASGAGKSAIVHPSIASIQIPYRLRLQQSSVGFGQALADELGATLKLADGRWLITVKNGGETASGTTMPPIVIPLADVSLADLTAEERPKHAKVEASYFDEDKGISQFETATGLGKVSTFFSLHPAASAAEAKVRSQSQALDLLRATISGSVTIEGDPNAMAGAPVVLDGFGDWNGTDLVAPTIQHEFTFDESGGWLMTPEFAARAKTG